MRHRNRARVLGCMLWAAALPSAAMAQDGGWATFAQPLEYQDIAGDSSQSRSASHQSDGDPSQPGSYDIEPPTPIAVKFTNWIIASQDNDDLPFIVIDKIAAEVFLYDAQGGLVGATPVLLGEAVGDDSVPGI